jgi:hypothetical protein
MKFREDRPLANPEAKATVSSSIHQKSRRRVEIGDGFSLEA